MLFVLFVCVCGFSSHSKIFHSYGDVTIAGEELQILTYARHSWSLSSESYLTWHTHCDAGLPFIMIISEDPWHSHLLPSVCHWSSHYLILRPSVRGSNTDPRRMLIYLQNKIKCPFSTNTTSICLQQWWKKPKRINESFENLC